MKLSLSVEKPYGCRFILSYSFRICGYKYRFWRVSNKFTKSDEDMESKLRRKKASDFSSRHLPAIDFWWQLYGKSLFVKVNSWNSQNKKPFSWKICSANKSFFCLNIFSQSSISSHLQCPHFYTTHKNQNILSKSFVKISKVEMLLSQCWIQKHLAVRCFHTSSQHPVKKYTWTADDGDINSDEIPTQKTSYFLIEQMSKQIS